MNKCVVFSYLLGKTITYRYLSWNFPTVRIVCHMIWAQRLWKEVLLSSRNFIWNNTVFRKNDGPDDINGPKTFAGFPWRFFLLFAHLFLKSPNCDLRCSWYQSTTRYISTAVFSLYNEWKQGSQYLLLPSIFSPFSASKMDSRLKSMEN